MSKPYYFTGPIFIVGMPRSGTKLLRDLLNYHSLVGITANESHVLPYFYQNAGKYTPLSQAQNFDHFYKDFTNTIFFQRLTANGHFSLNKSAWADAVQSWQFSGVIEAFYRLYARQQNKTIWGDKTPSYLLHMPLLKSLFPGAKFIHIIRDVRDYCLSIKKAWNKNMYRAAQRWHDSIIKCRRDAAAHIGADYLEVTYEALSNDPEKILRQICRFLAIPFENAMTSPTQPTENLGDTKNAVGIVKGNYGKWKKNMATETVLKIEKMCGSLLTELGYSAAYSATPKRLGNAEMQLYKVLDGLNLFRFQMQSFEFKKAVNNFTKSQKHREVGKGGEKPGKGIRKK